MDPIDLTPEQEAELKKLMAEGLSREEALVAIATAAEADDVID